MRKIKPMEKVLIELLNTLSKRDMEILRLRFLRDQTQDQVGMFYKVTKERVRQLEDRALSNINKTLSELLKKKK